MSMIAFRLQEPSCTALPFYLHLFNFLCFFVGITKSDVLRMQIIIDIYVHTHESMKKICITKTVVYLVGILIQFSPRKHLQTLLRLISETS